MSSLKSGGISLVFHAAFEDADDAFKIHELQGKSVILTIEVAP